MKFRERLKELRQKKGLSQETLAQILDVEQRTVSYWESGENQTSFEMLFKIAKELDCDIHHLLGWGE